MLTYEIDKLERNVIIHGVIEKEKLREDSFKEESEFLFLNDSFVQATDVNYLMD